MLIGFYCGSCGSLRGFSRFLITLAYPHILHPPKACCGNCAAGEQLRFHKVSIWRVHWARQLTVYSLQKPSNAGGIWHVWARGRERTGVQTLTRLRLKLLLEKDCAASYGAQTLPGVFGGFIVCMRPWSFQGSGSWAREPVDPRARGPLVMGKARDAQARIVASWGHVEFFCSCQLQSPTSMLGMLTLVESMRVGSLVRSLVQGTGHACWSSELLVRFEVPFSGPSRARVPVGPLLLI